MNTLRKTHVEARPSAEDARARFGLIEGTSSERARRTRAANDRWLVVYLLCSALLGVTMVRTIAFPAIETLAGPSSVTEIQGP